MTSIATGSLWRSGLGWLGADLPLFVLVLALSVIGFRIAEDEALSAAAVGDLLYYSAWVLPTLGLYLVAVWALGRARRPRVARAAAVLLGPLAYLPLYSLAAGDDTGATEVLLTLVLPPLAYGALVRIPWRAAGERHRYAPR
jgi:hypothetical protein